MSSCLNWPYLVLATPSFWTMHSCIRSRDYSGAQRHPESTTGSSTDQVDDHKAAFADCPFITARIEDIAALLPYWRSGRLGRRLDHHVRVRGFPYAAEADAVVSALAEGLCSDRWLFERVKNSDLYLAYPQRLHALTASPFHPSRLLLILLSTVRARPSVNRL